MKYKIQRESDGFFVTDHLNFNVQEETKEVKAFEFPAEIADSILSMVKEKYKNEIFNLIEV
jgi:hypothetical protein